MTVDEALAARVRDELAVRDDVSERRMFGGLSFMLAGNLCVGVIGEDLVVRVEPAASETLLAEPHTRRFDMTGRPMKGWIVVGPAALADGEALARWVARGVAFASTLPAKAGTAPP